MIQRSAPMRCSRTATRRRGDGPRRSWVADGTFGAAAPDAKPSRTVERSQRQLMPSTLDTARPLCFFCGGTDRPLTEEHVWPKWVSRLLFGRYNSGHFRHLRATGGTTTANWRSPYINVTTTTVCSDCNNQWLSSLETQIKLLASPLIVGEGVVSLALAPDSQALLAAWAYKMALLVEVSNPDTSTEFFTAADRLRFRQTTSAPQSVRVFLGRYNFGHRPAHATAPRYTLTDKAESPETGVGGEWP